MERSKVSRVFFCALLAYLIAGAIADAWATEETPEYVGAEECYTCHDGMEATFAKNIHSKTSFWNAQATGCEDCHGPGSVHVESGGDVAIAAAGGLESRVSNGVCLSCHDSGLAHTYWRGSAHDQLGVGCISCHSVHSNSEKMLNDPSEVNTCFACHPEQRTFASKRSTHRMNDSSRKDGSGKLSCSSCHNPHGTQSEKLIAANSINDKCYECHPEMQAPVLWEHSPVKENCLNCHDPHGSNFPNLLVTQRTRLCQNCHEAGRHQTVAGQEISFLVMNRGCSNCHAQVHGSNHPSGLKLKR